MTAYPALARLESLELRGMKLGLEAIGALCLRLDRPERRFPSVLVGGTNGKGSTAATLSSIAAACGVRAGLYTSPHLVRVTERIRIEEKDVLEEELDRALDLAILEVGLGGRFDATNVAPAVLSAVTSIGLDHMQELGDTLARIAQEKAGIFRRGRPALARATAPEALETLRAAAAETGADWHDASAELTVRLGGTGVEGTRFALSTPRREIALATPLPGTHQAWNSALAVRAAELLPEPALLLTAERLAEGVRNVRWPGRLERFVVGGRAVLLDGCHNTEGAAS